VEERLVELMADSHVDVLGSLPRGVLRHLVQGKLARIAGKRPKAPTYELRIQVPNMSYEFDGQGLADGDLKPRKIGGKFYLISFATYHPGKTKPWVGAHVAGKKQALKIDRDRKGLRADKEFCRLALPTKRSLKEGRHLPHPVWVARVKQADEGKRVGSDRWLLLDEMRGLEESLLG